jgi:threonine/homoserine/homoserine lactone efflux protein
MNPNDLIAQQQAIINQAMQTQQNWVWGMIAIQIAFLLIGAWVVYMFYARLRDIAEELMQLRVAYEFANQRKSDGNRPATLGETPANPFQGSKPKSS